jgi:hypothetical protein
MKLAIVGLLPKPEMLVCSCGSLDFELCQKINSSTGGPMLGAHIFYCLKCGYQSQFYCMDANLYVPPAEKVIVP